MKSLTFLAEQTNQCTSFIHRWVGGWVGGWVTLRHTDIGEWVGGWVGGLLTLAARRRRVAMKSLTFLAEQTSQCTSMWKAREGWRT